MNYVIKSEEKVKMFMSFRKICYGYEIEPSGALNKWLSEPTTLEFIQLGEELHNLDFNKEMYINLCSEALGIGSSPNVKDLIIKCKVRGISLESVESEEVYLYKDIAIDFASWASPAFRTFCLLQMQKNGNVVQNDFKSEEDFIISSKTLAQYTQTNALQNFKSLMDKFVYNYQIV